MSKLEKVFDTPNKKAFIGFLTAGDPDADSTVKFILEMEKAGADLIEIGIPFSDPTAEGVVIQEANIRSLSNGMTTDGVFEIVKRVREQSEIPLAFMTYVNPVFHYGYEKFFSKCEELGISAIIIPDVPYEEKAEVEAPAKAHGVKVISMIAPTSVYAGKEDLPKVLGGLGIAIISTNQGVITDKKARELQVGGEVLAFVW